MSSVGIEFPSEMLRLKELIQQYEEIGSAGAFGKAVIEAVLMEAEAAWKSQDVVALVRAFARMRECS